MICDDMMWYDRLTAGEALRHPFFSLEFIREPQLPSPATTLPTSSSFPRDDEEDKKKDNKVGDKSRTVVEEPSSLTLMEASDVDGLPGDSTGGKINSERSVDLTAGQCNEDVLNGSKEGNCICSDSALNESRAAVKRKRDADGADQGDEGGADHDAWLRSSWRL